MAHHFGKKFSVPFTDVSLHKTKEYIQAVSKIFQKGDYILGQEVEQFEKEFASYIGSKYCVGVASGTDAILLSLKVVGVSKDDEVIVPAFTFIASATPVLMLGAHPVFVDVKADLPVIDEDKIEAAITSKTRAILVVHLYGYPCNMNKIKAVARKYKIPVIEDVAQAHGSSYKNKKTGSLGDVGAFSFYPTKNLGAMGDAGAITTSNKIFYKKLLLFRDHGQLRKYQHTVLGYNSRLDSLQAAVLRIKLRELEKNNDQKMQHAAMYGSLLSGLPVQMFSLNKKSDRTPALYVFIIMTNVRDQLLTFLKQRGIFSMIHYPTILPDEKIFGLQKSSIQYPNARKYARSVLSLPFFARMTKKQIIFVVNAVTEFFVKRKI